MGECINCGKPLDKKNKKYCCQKCRAEYLKNTRICAVCGKRFWASPSSQVVTCGKACEKINRAKVSRSNVAVREGLEKAHIQAKISPNTGAFVTNVNAKSWIVRSPEGKIYAIDNLALWAREHETLLPGTAQQFCDGIRSIKRTIAGKKKRGSYQYKGWTLDTAYEDNLSRSGLPAPKCRNLRKKCLTKNA